MPTYYVMVGAPGAGKSTARNRYNCKVICPDEIRDEKKVDVKTAYDIAREEIPKSLQAGEDVLLDATNAFRDRRVGMINIGKPFADRVVCVWLDTPAETCITRHKEAQSRGERIGDRYQNHTKPYEEIIREYCDAINHDPPMLSEGFDEIIRLKAEDQ